MSDTTQNVPPGWYPDPNAPGGQRWWDGTEWTQHTGQDHAAQAYQPLTPQKAPEGTKTSTVWFWIIAVSPVLSLISLFIVDWKGIVDASIPTSLTSPANPYSQLAIYTSPGYVISSVLGWVSYAAIIVFAALDWRELRKRGVPQPFHWAFAFIPWTLVYVIGRSVVARRRAGGSRAAMWVYIALTAVVIVAYTILMVLLFNYMFQAISLLSTSYYS